MTHAENTFNLAQHVVHSLMAITGYENDAVNVLQEGLVPVRGKNTSRGGPGVFERLGIFFLSCRVIRVFGEG